MMYDVTNIVLVIMINRYGCVLTPMTRMYSVRRGLTTVVGKYSKNVRT